MPSHSKKTKQLERPPFILVILDGWGVAPASSSNAISLAKKPTYDYLVEHYPHTLLYAHGAHVGLPEDQVGNSEAGHLNIGSGRVVTQDAVYISEAINDGTFFKNSAFIEAFQHLEETKGRLHLIGILSGDQCPHMSPDHVIALAKMAHERGVKIFFHFFTDGRDSPPQSSLHAWRNLCSRIPYGSCVVASIAGRLYLDRKKDWRRTESVYNMLVLGEAAHEAGTFEEAVLGAYAREETDEFIKTTLIRNDHVTAHDIVADGDSVIFYNLRSDRARQLAKPFVQEEFERLNQDAFNRKKVLRAIKFV